MSEDLALLRDNDAVNEDFSEPTVQKHSVVKIIYTTIWLHVEGVGSRSANIIAIFNFLSCCAKEDIPLQETLDLRLGFVSICGHNTFICNILPVS